MTESQVWTLASLAQHLDAQLVGDETCRIVALNTLQDAGEGDLSFLANPAYQRYLTDTRASAVILRPDFAHLYDGNKLLLDNPYMGYARLTALFNTDTDYAPGIHPSAVVHADADVAGDAHIGANVTLAAGVRIGSGAVIGPGCVIGADTVIGARTRLHANVTVYHGVAIGEDVILHSGCVIGADGFGFAPGRDGWVKIHQLGGVVVGDRVEIGACTTVDRGALDNTVIADGVIIDNLVQIAHNVKIGENTAIAGCTGIAGSTTIGKRCTIAGAACIAGHITIADGVHISATTLVTKSIEEAGSYSSGTGMAPTRNWRRNAVRFGQLDQMAGRLAALEKKLSD